MIALLILIFIPLCLMFVGLYIIYKDCDKDELKYVKKYFNSYNKYRGK